MTYAKLSDSGRVIPSLQRCGELEWKLRYAQESITAQDMLVIAHYLCQYQAFHGLSSKSRNSRFKEYKLVWEAE